MKNKKQKKKCICHNKSLYLEVIAALHYNNHNGVIHAYAVYAYAIYAYAIYTLFYYRHTSIFVFFHVFVCSLLLRYMLESSAFYLYHIYMLRFIKVNVLAPSSVCFSTIATYPSSFSFMYLCVPCY